MRLAFFNDRKRPIRLHPACKGVPPERISIAPQEIVYFDLPTPSDSFIPFVKVWEDNHGLVLLVDTLDQSGA